MFMLFIMLTTQVMVVQKYNLKGVKSKRSERYYIGKLTNFFSIFAAWAA